MELQLFRIITGIERDWGRMGGAVCGGEMGGWVGVELGGWSRGWEAGV